MSSFIVIGGGPSAAIEASRLCSLGKNVTIITEQIGGCMEMMGDKRLQSYCNELTLHETTLSLADSMALNNLPPTANEYIQYIKRIFDGLPIKIIIGKVNWFTKIKTKFSCHVDSQFGKKIYYSDGLVLATGLKSKATPDIFSLLPHINCFSAYKLFNQNGSFINNYKRAVILGSGNTAFQLANIAVSHGLNTTILAREYLGIFPQETKNRFALRAPSQITIEKIWKSHDFENTDYLSFFIYSSLYSDGKYLNVKIEKSKNQIHIANISYSALSSDINGENTKILSIPSEDTLCISAIGVTCTLPSHNFSQLQLNDQGYISNELGRTAVAGLYVAGTLAGAKSVNTMNKVEYEYESQNAIG